MPQTRAVPGRIEDRLIVALDVPTIARRAGDGRSGSTGWCRSSSSGCG